MRKFYDGFFLLAVTNKTEPIILFVTDNFIYRNPGF